MTDAEIIKALEVCVGIHNDCESCPLLEYSQATDECMTELMSNALDLINRQKAEIERLEAEIDKQYEQARADILGNMSDGGASCHWCISQHKAEAIKEFAERFESKLNCIPQHHFTLAQVLFDLDKTKKRNGR